MSTIYFHIGQFKTGSTSIQRFLIKNKDALKDLGYLYPCENPVELHLFTLRLFECFFQEKNPHHCQDVNKLLKEMTSTSLDVIYSSEHLASFTQHLDKLANTFSSFDHKVIIYIRRADYYFESLYNQLVRDCLITNADPIEQYIEFFGQTEADRYMVVKKWSEAFGKENVTVVPFYEKQNATEIYTNFCTAINLTLDDTFTLPSNKRNISLPTKLIPLLKEVNRKFQSEPNKAYYVKLAIAEAYHRIGFDSFEKKSRFLSLKQRKEIIKISKPFDDKIAQEYFQKNYLFDYINQEENHQKNSDFFTQKEVEELIINTLGLLFDDHSKRT